MSKVIVVDRPPFPIVDGVEFRSVPGFERYAVTSSGEVWSCRVVGNARKHSELRWVKMRPAQNSKSGHLMVQFRRDGGDHKRFVHRLVLEAFVGPCPDGYECLHDNDTPGDNRLENLSWGTHKKNLGDAKDRRRYPSGERSPHSKLKAADVRSIRNMCDAGVSHSHISSTFGISIASVSLIRNRITWKYVT